MKRIQELAKDAYESVIRNTPSFLVTRELYEQKFAEKLIIECAQVADEYVKEGDWDIARIIREHFGVEE
jgi:hypothetical protein